jgi:hypothetical protein
VTFPSVILTVELPFSEPVTFPSVILSGADGFANANPSAESKDPCTLRPAKVASGNSPFDDRRRVRRVILRKEILYPAATTDSLFKAD